MSDCEKYIAMISAQADSELSPEEEAELSRHLEECPSCRRVKDAFAAISEALDEELVPAPETLASAVMDKVNSNKKKTQHTHLHVWSRYVAVAACAALIFFSASRSMPFSKSADNNSSYNGYEARSAAFDDEGDMGQVVPNASNVYDAADNADTTAGGEAEKYNETGIRGDTPDAANPESDTAVPLELNDRELLNLAEDFDTDALSRKLDELFASRTAALYGDTAYAELIAQGGEYPFFTFADAASASPLRSFIGQVYIESNQLTSIPEETPLITIRLYDGTGEDCFITVWAGDTIICLLTEGPDKTLFTADGSPEILITFINELMNLSVN